MNHSQSCLGAGGGPSDDTCICGAHEINQRPLVVYHGGCADGQGAAAAFYTKYPDAEYYPGVYGHELPDVSKRDVYLLDFSYPRGLVLAICAEARSVTIIDHHESAMIDLETLNVKPLTKIFDMSRSGAVMAWNYCWPEKKVPMGLLFIQDRDLWKFELEQTKPFNAYLYSIEFEIAEWSALLCDEYLTKIRMPEIMLQGEALLRQDAKRVKALMKHARYIIIEGNVVPVVNCNHYYASDLGHAMAPGHAFAATYYDTKDGRVFSLRSAPDGLNVSQIAKRLGGGGHAKAAGFKVSFAQAAEYEITK